MKHCLLKKRRWISINRCMHAGQGEHIGRGDYGAVLSALAGLRDQVDAFFDEVMVLVR